MLPKESIKEEPIEGWILNSMSMVETLPRPLYLMGYGSLLWKPGPFLENLRLVPVACPGYRRLFAQRSCDHRGTKRFPGLVLTLLDDAYITANSMRNLEGAEVLTTNIANSTTDEESASTQCRSDEISRCLAGVFEVDDDAMVPDLIAYLDEREKGGYTPAIVEVELLEATSIHEAGAMVKALVYVGASDNPNFYFPKSLSEEAYLNCISNIVCVATGPSGFNAEYLFKLVNYLSSRKFYDSHLDEVALRVLNNLSYVDADGSIIARRRYVNLKGDIIYFNSNCNSLLSNFAYVEGGVEFRGLRFPSSEHAIQSLKFVDKDRPRFAIGGDLSCLEAGLELISHKCTNYKVSESSKTRYLASGMVGFLAKLATEEQVLEGLGLTLIQTLSEIESSETDSLWVEEILKNKFSSANKEFRDFLLSTGDIFLLDNERWMQSTTSKNQGSWSGGDIINCKLVGENRMGKLLMEMRHSIRTFEETNRADAGALESADHSLGKLSLFAKPSGYIERSFEDRSKGRVFSSIFACGSNEYSQIDPFCNTKLLSFCKKASFLDKLYYKPLVNVRGRNQILQLLDFETIFTGSSASAVLSDSNVLILFGNLTSFPEIDKISQSHDVKNMIAISDVSSCAIAFEHLAILFTNGRVLCLGDDSFGQCSTEISINIPGVVPCNKSKQANMSSSEMEFPACSGKTHELKHALVANLLSMDPNLGQLKIPVFTLADISSSTSAAPDESDRAEGRETVTDSEKVSKPFPSRLVRQRKVSVGYRHSAAISNDRRRLYLWGDNSRGQCGWRGADASSDGNNGGGGGGSTVSAPVWNELDNCSSFLDVRDVVCSEATTIPKIMGLKVQNHSTKVESTNSADSKSRVCQYYEWILEEEGLSWMDVACGAYFTVAIDSTGRVWSVGDNRYGQLGRRSDLEASSSSSSSSSKHNPTPGNIPKSKSKSFDSFPRIVPGLDYDTIKFDKVCCGMSHTAIQGVSIDGQRVVYALGRRDMGQYTKPLDDHDDHLHHRLAQLPPPLSRKTTNSNGVAISNAEDPFDSIVDRVGTEEAEAWKSEVRQVWCGSEFMYACDYDGNLFSVGWGEHGNLGSVDIGDGETENNDAASVVDALTNGCAFEWRPVLACRAEQPSESLTSDGAAGGDNSDKGDDQLFQVCLGNEFASTRSVSCGGGHVFLRLSEKVLRGST